MDAVTLLLVVLCGLLGLAFGSFANVVLHRVRTGESFVRPPSACPSCRHPIAPRDNIPVLSWLLLRGRCRHCRAPISPRYPLVEAATAVVFALVAAKLGPDWALPGFLFFAWLLLVVAVIDAQTRKIPNRLTYPGIPVLALLLVVAALLDGDPGRALRVLLAGAAGFVALLVMALISPRAMGMGDVKLAAFIGLGLGYLSWWHLLFGLFAAFLLGGVIGLVLLVTRIRSRREQLPFGPYLAAGAILVVLAGEPLIAPYRAVFGG